MKKEIYVTLNDDKKTTEYNSINIPVNLSEKEIRNYIKKYLYKKYGVDGWIAFNYK